MPGPRSGAASSVVGSKVGNVLLCGEAGEWMLAHGVGHRHVAGIPVKGVFSVVAVFVLLFFPLLSLLFCPALPLGAVPLLPFFGCLVVVEVVVGASRESGTAQPR